MFAAMQVAKFFLALSDEDSGDLMSNLKLQKLLYYAQGMHLALYDEPLFNESIEAWTHGPVVPSVYHEFKRYGSDSIPPPEDFDPSVFDDQTEELLSEVYEVFGQFSAWKLRNMTHSEPPWKKAITGGIISRKSLKEYFTDYVEEDD